MKGQPKGPNNQLSPTDPETNGTDNRKCVFTSLFAINSFMQKDKYTDRDEEGNTIYQPVALGSYPTSTWLSK